VPANVILNPGAGGATLATDQVGGVDYQKVKITFSTDGAAPVSVDAANGLPVSIASLPLPAGAATLAGQAAINATLGTPMQQTGGAVSVTNFPATQPVSGTVTANQGTAAAVSGAWPSLVTDGTRTATVKAASTAAVAADTALVVAISPNNNSGVTIPPSITDSTATPLAANASFTGTANLFDSWNAGSLQVYSDASGSLALQWSTDGVNYDFVQTFPYTGGIPMDIGLYGRSRRLRIVYTNGPAAQVIFRLQLLVRNVSPAGDATSLRDPIPSNLMAQATRSQLIGQTDTTGSLYAPVSVKAGGVTPIPQDGALVVAERSGALAILVDQQAQILAELRAMNLQLSSLSGNTVDVSTFLSEITVQ